MLVFPTPLLQTFPMSSCLASIKCPTRTPNCPQPVRPPTPVEPLPSCTQCNGWEGDQCFVDPTPPVGTPAPSTRPRPPTLEISPPHNHLDTLWNLSWEKLVVFELDLHDLTKICKNLSAEKRLMVFSTVLGKLRWFCEQSNYWLKICNECFTPAWFDTATIQTFLEQENKNVLYFLRLVSPDLQKEDGETMTHVLEI